jgi:hypothetical protein
MRRRTVAHGRPGPFTGGDPVRFSPQPSDPDRFRKIQICPKDFSNSPSLSMVGMGRDALTVPATRDAAE